MIYDKLGYVIDTLRNEGNITLTCSASIKINTKHAKNYSTTFM